MTAWALSLLVAGCASRADEGRYAWADGWRRAEVTAIMPSPEKVTQVAANCRRSGPWTPIQRFATVRHLWDHHPVWRTVPIATDASWKVGDLVYVNVEDCEAPLQARAQ